MKVLGKLLKELVFRSCFCHEFLISSVFLVGLDDYLLEHFVLFIEELHELLQIVLLGFQFFLLLDQSLLGLFVQSFEICYFFFMLIPYAAQLLQMRLLQVLYSRVMRILRSQMKSLKRLVCQLQRSKFIAWGNFMALS